MRETGSEDKWGYSFKELTPFSNPAERGKRIEVSLLSCHEILLISDLISAPELISESLRADCRRIMTFPEEVYSIVACLEYLIFYYNSKKKKNNTI